MPAFDTADRPIVSKREVRTVGCPDCGAAVAVQCWDAHGATANHLGRLVAYLQSLPTLAPVAPPRPTPQPRRKTPTTRPTR